MVSLMWYDAWQWLLLAFILIIIVIKILIHGFIYLFIYLKFVKGFIPILSHSHWCLIYDSLFYAIQYENKLIWRGFALLPFC